MYVGTLVYAGYWLPEAGIRYRWSTPGRSGVPMRPLLLELNFYCGEAECYFGDFDLKYCV